MNSPVISVIIPMYNVEKTIEHCLQSVTSQTFDAIEIICVDDGCSDDTVKLVKRIDDPRIRIVHQRNRGLAAARNTGINASKGLFIALLDSDDYWDCNKLALHFEHLQSDPALGVSYSASAFVDDNNQAMGIGQNPKNRDITAAHILCRNPVGNGSAPVIRRIALEEIAFSQVIDGDTRKAFFNENLRQSEDIELWIRMALSSSWKFEGIDRPLTFYRINSSGLSADLTKQLASWEHAITLNRADNAEFFDRWYPLARAYQKRYLARRAIQSNNSLAAITLFVEAIASSPRIFLQEPSRTAITGICALLSMLPKSLYERLQSFAIQTLVVKNAS